ncbi:uncharacterized protein LOC129790562 [Lutzomyia longipalpis]|uniref:uncharacterized protein LOC129790562 n=1 Tax=Lutzomyia longipalpis TaxID=7200 RepID=UPI002483ACFA|nr:uncharacterized protein LOC129790562 [Lutzomyia longipalpis]
MKRIRFVARYFNFLHIFVIVIKCGAGMEANASSSTAAPTTKSPSTIYFSDNQPNPVAAFVNSAAVSGRALFSPRVDYNEWMPVGRGDPLKNDPTYDYSPPFLERVRYWESGGGKQEKSGEILLLGVPSKKPSIPQRKDFKYLTMRRNFYQLPTILMPPPMQTTEKYRAPMDTWTQRPVDAVAEASMSIATPMKTTYVKPLSAMSYGEMVKPPKSSYLHTILQKETLQRDVVRPTTPPLTTTTSSVVMQRVPSVFEVHQSTAIVTKTTPGAQRLETSTHFTPTAPPMLTTDAYFSHYNQPQAPIPGPMYLIIEGHSKVKTYSSSDPPDGKHHANIVPVVSTEDPVVRRVVNEEAPLGVKHLHFRVPEVRRKPHPTKTSAMDSLLSFLDVSFGGFLGDDAQTDTQNSIESNGLETSVKGDKRQARIIGASS